MKQEFPHDLVNLVKIITTRAPGWMEAENTLTSTLQGYAFRIIEADPWFAEAVKEDKDDLGWRILEEFLNKIRVGEASFKYDGQVVRYLETLTFRRCIDGVRSDIRRNNHKASALQQEEEQLPYTHPHPAYELSHDILAILDEMPALAQVIFLLSARGYTLVEIAECLHIKYAQLNKIFHLTLEEIEERVPFISEDENVELPLKDKDKTWAEIIKRDQERANRHFEMLVHHGLATKKKR